jgi:hypothetical protein
MHVLSRFMLLAILLSILAACGRAPSVAAPAADQSALPVVEQPAPAPTDPPAPTAAPAATATPEPTATIAPTATPQAAEPGTSRSSPLALGSELRFEHWAVTITGVARGDDAAHAIAGANQFNEPAPEGWQYLLAGLTLTNISTEQEAKSVLFGVDLRVTSDRNVLYSRASVVVPQPLEGELFPEGSAEGQIAFLVPADEANLMFYVAESFSFDLDGRRFVAIDEGASIGPDSTLAKIAPTDAGAQRNSPAALGTTAVSEEWELTVLEIFRGAEAAQRITEANQFNEPAPEGQEYIIARVRARYLGGDDPDAAASIDQNAFKITGAANVIYDRPSVVAPVPQLEAHLFPGGEAEGWTVVLAPIGEAGLTLVYEPLFEFGSENLRFLGLE